MGECRGGGGGGDCLIKLFGTTIPVPEAGDAKRDLQHSGSSSSSSESDVQDSSQQDASDPPPQPEVVDAEDPKSSPSQPGDDMASQKEKLRKPDKVLPCPRCNSMDTKFCYFNNYNVNQPRHFCKNCQRYWTAGGAMRNVPVGAGRRKNKNAVAASHFLQRVRAALPADDPLKTTNGTVLSFGHGGAPAALDLAEQVSHLKEKLLVPVGNACSRPAAGPCSEASSNNQGCSKEKVTVEKPANGVQQHPTMWPYGCAPPPAYYSSGIAIPIYPAAPGYWGCMVPGAWSLPWPVQPPPSSQGLSSPTSAPSVSSGSDSLTLGKHPREGDEGRGDHGGGKVWAPKTIRIDDADEVARSSIWSLIGIKGNKQHDADSCKQKLGTVFEPKCEAEMAKHAVITSLPLLHANPVALTRSATFQEGS
ncbi:hypothetical protein ACP70R_021120 [Stipagrostis hirtigluma subsp. patula]